MNQCYAVTDDLGRRIYSSQELEHLLLNGGISDFFSVAIDTSDFEITKFNLVAEELWMPLLSTPPKFESRQDFDLVNQENWKMPQEYKELDIEAFVRSLANTNEEKSRVNEEMEKFKEKGLINMLRWLKYFVDTCEKYSVIRGVGRGSSVASYVLYLLGVHKVDSLKYELNWREFLRD